MGSSSLPMTIACVKRSGSHFISLLVYVDDILITGENEGMVLEVKHYLHKQFTIKDLDYAKFFLGLEIARLDIGMFLY